MNIILKIESYIFYVKLNSFCAPTSITRLFPLESESIVSQYRVCFSIPALSGMMPVRNISSKVDKGDVVWDSEACCLCVYLVSMDYGVGGAFKGYVMGKTLASIEELCQVKSGLKVRISLEEDIQCSLMLLKSMSAILHQWR